MDTVSVIGSVSDRYVPKKPIGTKNFPISGSALSYSSSSGYSTQSLSSELTDSHSIKNQLQISKNISDNTSHNLDLIGTPNFSQTSSQASLNHPSNLNILNPTNLCSSHVSQGTESIMSYMRTSTPTMPINSTHFHNQNSSYFENSSYITQNRPVFNNKINFNPTCNSSLNSVSQKEPWTRNRSISDNYSIKSTPGSRILPENYQKNQINSIDFNMYQKSQPIKNIKPARVFIKQDIGEDKVEPKVRMKWSNSASNFFTYFVKLISCFNIFKLIKTPKKTRKIVRKPAKTNHSVIEMVRQNYEGKNANSNDIYSNLNGSFKDSEKNYYEFSKGPNYIASTPIEKKGPVVKIINNFKNIQFDEKETYDNVQHSTVPNSTNSLNFDTLSGMSSTQIGLNINISKDMPSKYSTVVHSLQESIDPISSYTSSEMIEDTSEISKKSDFYLSMIQLNKKPQKSDFIQSKTRNIENSERSMKFIDIKQRGNYENNKSGPKPRPRPVYEDFLCDQEVESYFVSNPKKFTIVTPVVLHSQIVKTAKSNYINKVPNKVFYGSNNVYSSKGSSNNLRRNHGLIGSGLVRQTHGESYC